MFGVRCSAVTCPNASTSSPKAGGGHDRRPRVGRMEVMDGTNTEIYRCDTEYRRHRRSRSGVMFRKHGMVPVVGFVLLTWSACVSGVSLYRVLIEYDQTTSLTSYKFRPGVPSHYKTPFRAFELSATGRYMSIASRLSDPVDWARRVRLTDAPRSCHDTERVWWLVDSIERNGGAVFWESGEFVWLPPPQSIPRSPVSSFAAAVSPQHRLAVHAPPGRCQVRLMQFPYTAVRGVRLDCQVGTDAGGPVFLKRIGMWNWEGDATTFACGRRPPPSEVRFSLTADAGQLVTNRVHVSQGRLLSPESNVEIGLVSARDAGVMGDIAFVFTDYWDSGSGGAQLPTSVILTLDDQSRLARPAGWAVSGNRLVVGMGITDLQSESPRVVQLGQINGDLEFAWPISWRRTSLELRCPLPETQSRSR